ncbi:chaplin [Streptomyces sp. NPDC057743]|uniref:chaplin n=1 Tax=Streptomyces sp. NPDC057743 TaxID=3346236 RepID=UPI0036BFA815
MAALAVGTALGGSSVAFADSGAGGGAVGSPGVISGNVIQIPLHVPINLCGNTIDIIGLLNPAFGNNCLNGHFMHHKEKHHKEGHRGHHGRHHHNGGGRR